MDENWKQALREGAIAGSCASVASAAALLAAGRHNGQHPAAPVNAVSHWLWGDPALRRDAPSWRHTFAGYVVHHGASIFWAVLHARAWGIRPRARRPLPALAGSAVAAGLACWVDYRLTPARFTPGFEHRLSRGQMAAVYASLALGLAAGSLLAQRLSRRSRHEAARGSSPARR